MTARLTHIECTWAQEVPLVILNAANFKNDIKRIGSKEIGRSKDKVIAPPLGTNVDD